MIRYRAIEVLPHWEMRHYTPIDYYKEEMGFTMQVNGRESMSEDDVLSALDGDRSPLSEIYSFPPFKRDKEYIPGEKSVESFPPDGWTWKDHWYRLEGDDIFLYKVFKISGRGQKLVLENSDYPYPVDKWQAVLSLSPRVPSCSYWIIFEYNAEELNDVSLPYFRPFEYSPKTARQIRRATRKQRRILP